MVARIVSGKGIRGVISYNENKVRQAEAELLMAAGFPRDHTRLNFQNKLARFEMLTAQNAATKTNALHISLNFSTADQVDNEMLCSIAADYMARIGFADQPFLVYRHYDAAHPHIHIATVNIQEGGNRIETHNIGRNQSEAARKEIENLYGLQKAEGQKTGDTFELRPAKLVRAQYGKAATKAALNSVVREVTTTYRFTSLPELNAVLGQFNVRADPGAEGTIQREKGGLVYQLLGPDGMPVGVPIKASAFYGSPTLKYLQKRFDQNETERKPYGLRLKHLLTKALRIAADPKAFFAALRGQGIRILLRQNVQGNIYGVTFIDNATRSVFNGSDLGTDFKAKAFMDRLQRSGLWPPPADDRVETDVINLFPAAAEPVIEARTEQSIPAGEKRVGGGGARPLKRKRGLGAE